METGALRVACDLSGLDLERRVGVAGYAAWVLEGLAGCAGIELVGPEALAGASVLLNLDGRFRAGRGQRVVTTVLDLGHLLAPSGHGTAERLSLRWRTASAARRSHHLLVPSEAVRAGLERYLRVPAVKVTVLPAVPGPGFRRRSRAAVEELRRELGLPERYFLFVGRRSRRKNLDLLGEAWLRAGDRLPAGTGLVLAGPGQGGLPGALDLGYIAADRLPGLLSGALAFVSPSLYEGSALGALEAMACGAPPVVAATGALPHAVGRAGVVLDPHDAGEWAEALVTLAGREQLRAALAAAALKAAAEARAAAAPLPALARALKGA